MLPLTLLLLPSLVLSKPLHIRNSTCPQLFTLTATTSNQTAYSNLTVVTNTALWLALPDVSSELYEGPNTGSSLPVAHFYQNDTTHLYATGFDLYETNFPAAGWTALPPPYQVLSYVSGDAFVSDVPGSVTTCTITGCTAPLSASFSIEDGILGFASTGGGVGGTWACPDGSYEGLWQIKLGAATFSATNLGCEQVTLAVNYIDAGSADVC